MEPVTDLTIKESGIERKFSAGRIKRALVGRFLLGERTMTEMEAASRLVRARIAPNSSQAKEYLDYLSGEKFVYGLGTTFSIERVREGYTVRMLTLLFG